jgi:hypothetical protein
MMKRLFTVILFIGAACVYGGDVVVLSYLPSLYGKTAGADVVWSRFRGREYEESFSLPAEVKFVVASIGGVALNASIGCALYIEKDGNTGEWEDSIGVTLGMGVSAADESRAMRGFFINAYPLYEFPAIAFADPVAWWKVALDAGYALDLRRIDELSALHVTFYSRMIGAFADTGAGTKFYLNWPDFGIAIGVHIFWHKPL